MTAQAKALEVFGIHTQLRKLAEECAELAVAALHVEEGRPGADTALLEELADVEIMLEQMRLHYGDQAVDSKRISKLMRLEQRLAGREPKRPPTPKPSTPAAPAAPAQLPLNSSIADETRAEINRIQAIPGDPLLTLKEAALITGRTYTAIYQAVKNNRIVGEMVGPKPKVLRSEVLAYYGRKHRIEARGNKIEN